MANLTRYDPFSDIDNFFRGFTLRPIRLDKDLEAPQIKIDVKEDDKLFTIHAEMPGVRKEDIKVTVDGNQVAISGEIKRESQKKDGERLLHSECYHGTVYRAFALDSAIDDKAAQAKYDNGVLELKLPKKTAGGPAKLTVS
jgi:HSP20 family protein